MRAVRYVAGVLLAFWALVAGWGLLNAAAREEVGMTVYYFAGLALFAALAVWVWPKATT